MGERGRGIMTRLASLIKLIYEKFQSHDEHSTSFIVVISLPLPLPLSPSPAVGTII